MAGLFLVGYLGMALPVVLLGLILQTTALVPSVMMFGAVMLALIFITTVTLARACGRGNSLTGPTAVCSK